MLKYCAENAKDLLDWLRDEGLITYGAVVSVERIHKKLEIVIPDMATKQEFDTLALTELNYIEYVRNALVKRGMYFQRNGAAYRILLPSENSKKVESLMNSASKKLNRAVRLSKNTPKADGVTINCNMDVRLAAKEDSIRDAREQARLLS